MTFQELIQNTQTVLVDPLRRRGKMDSIDQQILELLALNARRSNRSIAKVVGTSDRTVARRINKLERYGFIHQYTLKLGPAIVKMASATQSLQVNASVQEWESLRASLTKFFGSGASFILFQIGYSISQNWSAKLHATGLTPSSQLLAFLQLLEKRGWGCMDIRHLDIDAKSGTLAVVNSPFKTQRRPHGCDEVKGMVTGFLETLFATTMLVSETQCVGQGHTHCEFTFTGASI